MEGSATGRLARDAGDRITPIGACVFSENTDSSRTFRAKKKGADFQAPFNLLVFNQNLVAGGGFEPPTFGL